MSEKITVETFVPVPMDLVWKCWTGPEHITQWANASDDWHAPVAQNDLRVGGAFNTRMEAKDGSKGFNFEGTYTAVEINKRIDYTMLDGRKVEIQFMEENNGCKIVQTFDSEDENFIEMQKDGWQSILNNFKQYVLEQVK